MNPLRNLFSDAAAVSAATGPASQTTEQVSPRDAIVKLLEAEGCKPRFDKDNDLVFVRSDLTYVLIFSAKDPEYLRLMLPNFCAIGTDAERAAAYEAANLTNATCKAAKVTVERGQTHAYIECFFASLHHTIPVLMRCAEALDHAARSFGVAYAMIRRR